MPKYPHIALPRQVPTLDYHTPFRPDSRHKNLIYARFGACTPLDPTAISGPDLPLNSPESANMPADA